MSLCLCTGAVLKCPFGSLPAVFNALPLPGVTVEGRPAGVITDLAPMVNLPAFGLCKSPSNPTVASATAGAMGVLTPMPCVPVPVGAWRSPSQSVRIGGRAALTSDSQLMCAWGGQISVQNVGQSSVRL